MRISAQKKADAVKFSNILKKTSQPNKIDFGNFQLKIKRGVSQRIQYNESGLDLLKNKHEYTIKLLDGSLELSLQLYLNIANHFRLFCFTKKDGIQGMTFSVNLTTEKESKNIIYLSQKIKFTENHTGNKVIAKAHRRQKQIFFCDLLKKLGYEVTENFDIILGIFDPQKGAFINTTPEKFLNDFIAVSLLKGHFQGNKGYQLEILPSFNKLDYIFTGKEESTKNTSSKVKTNRSKRNVPLGMRYMVLKRDGFKCVACGRNVEDGAKLHIDHKTPYSLG